MTLTGRLILTVTLCVALTTTAIAATTGLLAANALIRQAEGMAQSMAGLIAESAARSDLAAAEMEAVMGAEMTAQGLVLAHLAEAVTAAGGDSADLTGRFAEITAKSVIGDIWLLDADQRVLAASVGPYYGLTDPDGAPMPLGWQAFNALADGSRFAVTTIGHGSTDHHAAGVRVSGGRVLILAQPPRMQAHLADQIGIEATIQALAVQPGMGHIRVVDDALGLVAGDRETPMSELESRLAMQAIHSVGSQYGLSETGLWIAVPIVDTVGISTGAVLIRMQRDYLDDLLRDTLTYGGAAAMVVFLVGAMVAAVAARRVTRPVVRLTEAAEAMDARCFHPDTLNDLIRSRDELGHLAEVFQQMARQVQAREDHLEGLVRARTRDLEDKNHQLEAAKAHMESELDIARSLQATMLPQRMPAHSAYAGRATMTPAKDMSGDFYDFFPLGTDQLGLVIADVSGKGVPAAFFMAISRTVLQSNAQDIVDPGACLARVNDALCEQNPLDLFVTVFYGVLDLRTGALRYANGGHNPPLRLFRDGVVEEVPRTGGMALGVMPGMPYVEASVTLQIDDMVFLYTDGISEAMNGDGQAFTEERLSAVLSGARGDAVDEVLQRVTDAVQAFVGGAPQSDDITCLALRYLGWHREEQDQTDAAMSDHGLSRHWELSGRLDDVGQMAENVDALVADGALSRREGQTAQLVIEEVLMNVIDHGLAGVETPRLSLTLCTDARTVEVIVRDNGPPFDPLTEAPAPDLEADLDERPIGGLGIHLVREMMDSVTYSRDGTTNKLRMVLQRQTPQT